jgi:hypothetical protein
MYVSIANQLGGGGFILGAQAREKAIDGNGGRLRQGVAEPVSSTEGGVVTATSRYTIAQHI